MRELGDTPVDEAWFGGGQKVDPAGTTSAGSGSLPYICVREIHQGQGHEFEVQVRTFL